MITDVERAQRKVLNARVLLRRATTKAGKEAARRAEFTGLVEFFEAATRIGEPKHAVPAKSERRLKVS